MILTGTSEGWEMSLPLYYCIFRCKTKITIQIILQCAAVLYLFCLCFRRQNCANWNKSSQETNTCSPCSNKHTLSFLLRVLLATEEQLQI